MSIKCRREGKSEEYGGLPVPSALQPPLVGLSALPLSLHSSGRKAPSRTPSAILQSLALRETVVIKMYEIQ